MTKKRTTKGTDAVTIMNEVLGNDPERRARIEQIKQDMAVGQQIYEARKAAGLTQAQLAKRVGTTQSVISDMEDAEYEGHSMPMLRRIASALDLAVVVSFIPSPGQAPHDAA
jgi:ribosome-binding protein aMBF1 (putative translation factor)